MLQRLSLKEIKRNYNKQFHNESQKIDSCDKIIYFFFPWVLAIVLSLSKSLDNDLKNLLGTIFSILIGMYLTLIVLLISNITIDKKEIPISQQRTRLDLIEETIYVILFAVSRSIYTIIFLLLISFIDIKNIELELFFRILIGEHTNTIFKTFTGIFMYLNACKSIICFFIIIRSLTSLFSSDLLIERTKLSKQDSANKH